MKNLILDSIKDKILYIEDINEGLKKYSNAILKIDLNKEGEENFIKFLYEIDENIIVDYYGNIINDSAFMKMVETLDEEEKSYLLDLKEKGYKEIFYSNIEEKFLKILINLSINEILFSSFYLKNMTIWGNYNGKFIMFFNKETNIKDIENKANKYNLQIEDIKEV
ncbi:hypothetical protein [uncultured Clostridium sp.]|uniref:hypothetical protein n=1 Tax=uncultured Clostridium sp. TaxID=59620 RepID=UPI002623484A|nr:hypothetical protein [uncultured Clostridium sp.]